MNAFWYWLQPALGALLAIAAIYTIVMLFWGDAAGIPSIQFGVNGVFIFPGLLISLGVNQLILRRRSPRIVTKVERILLGILVGLIALLVVTSFDVDSLAVGLIVWPVLILFAISVTIVILVTNARFAAPVLPQAAVYGAADEPAEPDATSHNELDDLFGDGKA